MPSHFESTDRATCSSEPKRRLPVQAALVQVTRAKQEKLMGRSAYTALTVPENTITGQLARSPRTARSSLRSEHAL